MTTAAELITFLQQLPADTPIKVLKERRMGYETNTVWTNLNLNNEDMRYYNSDPNAGLYLGMS
jgi:hypothetical protein